GSPVNIINGDRSVRSEWNISLAAQRLGVTTIPAFTIDNASSTPIDVTVKVDPEEPKISDLIELQNKLSKSQLYPNESATLTTRLIIKTDPRRLQDPFVVPPKAEGVELSAIGEPKQYQSVIDGVEVTIVDQSYLVTANSAGQFQLSGIGFQGSVVYGDRRSGTTKLISATTPAQQFQIQVVPIPNDYQGTWLPATSLKLSQQWLDGNGNEINASEIFATRVGDSLTRIINLDIQGLTSERFPEFNSNYPATVRLYQEKPQFTELGNGTTRMTIKQVIIPEQTGDIALNPISLNWWDSAQKSAQKSQLAGLKVTVEPGSTLNNEPISAPAVQQPQTKAVTVHDAGYWPYLTALFASLWLVTMLLWFKQRQTSTEQEPELEGKPTTVQLIQALKQDDKVKANYLAKQWLSENQQLDPERIEEIENQLNAMNHSQYSAESPNWQPEALIKLIKQSSKGPKVETESNNKLAQL
ncbi:BatD family protein, partial [Vibrio sp. M260118]|uniref:BatD family protein n=1 Tax=Vibrio sp. M260118 TaxID=3020896 RepID=UPI002F40944B